MSKLYSFPYGRGILEFSLPEQTHTEWIQPPEMAAHPDPPQLIREALNQLIGRVDRSKLDTGIKVGVAVLDGTRPDVNPLLLPSLLEWLAVYGIKADEVHLVLASGVHPRPSDQELEQILPDQVCGSCRFQFHDARDKRTLTYLGETDRGTPVWINQTYLACDFKVAFGVIAPHQFQGYSGGVKGAAIGLAGYETIESNHAHMVDPASRLGQYEQNPTRQDVEAIGRMVGIDLALDLVLNRDGEVVAAFAGDPLAVMQAGIPICRQASCTPVEGQFDMIIASAGGHPRDINLYQAQKGLAHACLITRTSGCVVLLAACPQGSGSQAFEAAVADQPSPGLVIDRFQSGAFRLGAHKAFQIARDVVDRTVYLLSDMEASTVRRYLLNPSNSIEATLGQIDIDLSTARVGLMPRASITIPIVAD
jgi:nickel-dependent lactate racemase